MKKTASKTTKKATKKTKLTLEQKRENLTNRMGLIIDQLINKTEKDIIASIAFLEPNTKIFAKNWVLPSVNIQRAFIAYVDRNPELLKNERVLLIYSYFKNEDVCKNCDNCQHYCYNWRAYRFDSVLFSRIIRLYQYLVHRDKLKAKLIKQARREDIIRLHVEGETTNEEMLFFWLDIVNECPNTTFYTYTKNYSLFEEYASMIPDNLKVQLSYDEENKHFSTIYKLNKTGKFKVFYTSSLDEDNKPIYRNLESFKNENIVKCKGKCELCKNCVQDDNRIIMCDLH